MNSRAGNQEWLDANLGSWMKTYFGHDAAYIVNPANQPIYASVDGAKREPSSLANIWPPTSALVNDLRKRLRRGDRAGTSDRVLTIGASDIVVVSGRPAIISVKPIVSDSGEIEQEPGEEFLHIAVRYLDDSLVQELQSDYLLDGLRFSWTAETLPREAKSPLTNSAGDVLGYYVWAPYRPGSAVFTSIWPILSALVVFGIAACSGLVLVLRRRSLSLNRTQAAIRHLATHDSLTGLPNRNEFDHRLEETIAVSRRDDHPMALLYLDLDHFKQVNDTLGHPAGDQLLREFADRLRRATAEGDIVGRPGGDEFTIILHRTQDLEEVERLCTKLVESARHPFDLAGTQVFIGVSVGAALCPNDGKTAVELTRKADIALYSAKANGRSGYAIFNAEMEALIAQRRELERDLRSSLECPEQFEVHYQPLFSAKQRSVEGVEALVRWNHPVRGRVPPDAFIPLAEESGLIERIGEIVLRRACLEASGWPIKTVAVNVSAVELKSPSYAVRVANILMSTGFSPQRLELEVTETAMSDKDGAGQHNLAALRQLGVRFALDDFGTGFSSLGRLQQLDVDRIKIDRSFVHGFGSATGDEAIVRAIVGLAKATGLKTTAEGVETAEQSEFLGAIGCDDLQGFLLGRPVPAADIDAILAGRPNSVWRA
ncbi:MULTISPECIES: EAL domain-containing protein [unclassified Mesorhizobium]|uniref:bifunctional diguanylate cyclase/phosphodiesterase n=1 Tax=unclassified Mesorhizobium TaxID=325217 RepID=UPI001CC99EC7|nr:MULTISPECIES: EAL domain-containing protein [unclassified Mesorhizobium]MBZ9701704.1 EAL domain-containing protein [Mesorhizobium sp. CO1-1-3]MBZ9949052.1 EAL domain-containing protein [Mesorhizobium sp. BR1-1-11]